MQQNEDKNLRLGNRNLIENGKRRNKNNGVFFDMVTSDRERFQMPPSFWMTSWLNADAWVFWRSVIAKLKFMRQNHKSCLSLTVFVNQPHSPVCVRYVNVKCSIRWKKMYRWNLFMCFSYISCSLCVFALTCNGLHYNNFFAHDLNDYFVLNKYVIFRWRWCRYSNLIAAYSYFSPSNSDLELRFLQFINSS